MNLYIFIILRQFRTTTFFPNFPPPFGVSCRRALEENGEDESRCVNGIKCMFMFKSEKVFVSEILILSVSR